MNLEEFIELLTTAVNSNFSKIPQKVPIIFEENGVPLEVSMISAGKDGIIIDLSSLEDARETFWKNQLQPYEKT